jgi:pseudouridine-5'-phosphate glycosidase
MAWNKRHLSDPSKETQGVNVVTFGEEKDFPAFYVPKSGFMESLRSTGLLSAD